MKKEFTHKDGLLTIDWEMYKRAMRFIASEGGRSRSPAKIAAARKNAQKARAQREANRARGV